MKFKGISWFWVLGSIIVHILLFSNELPREYVIERRWERNLIHESSRIAIGSVSQNGIGFSHNNYYGYVNTEGEVLHLVKGADEVALNDTHYIAYKYNQESDMHINQWGIGRQGTFSAGGYPMFVNDSLYLLGPYAQNLSKITLDARILWNVHFSSPVTNVVANEQNTFVTTLTGDVFDGNGTMVLEGDGYPIYASAVSPSHFLVLGGAKLQQGRLYAMNVDENEEAENTAIEYFEERNAFTMEHPVRQQMPALFRDTDTALFAGDEQLIMLDEQGSNVVQTRHILALRSGVAIFAIEEDGYSQRYFSAWNDALEPLFSVSTTSNSDFFVIKEGNIYLAANAMLLSLSVLYE